MVDMELEWRSRFSREVRLVRGRRAASAVSELNFNVRVVRLWRARGAESVVRRFEDKERWVKLGK